MLLIPTAAAQFDPGQIDPAEVQAKCQPTAETQCWLVYTESNKTWFVNSIWESFHLAKVRAKETLGWPNQRVFISRLAGFYDGLPNWTATLDWVQSEHPTGLEQ